MNNDEERFFRSNFNSGNEPLSRDKDERLRRNQRCLKSFCASWCTSRICFVAAGFRNSGGCNHRVCKKSLINKIWCADDLILISESTQNSRGKFFKGEEAFGSKKLKIYLWKTNGEWLERRSTQDQSRSICQV